jgi:hypothetical protein
VEDDMKKYYFGFLMLAILTSMVLFSSVACDKVYVLNPPGASPATPTFTSTPFGAFTGTPTFTPTWTNTPTGGCNTYSDSFTSAATLANYDYYLNSSETTSTAAGCDYTIAGGYLLVDPTTSPGTNNGGLAIVNNAYFSHSLTHYTITASFEMDNETMGEGVFGLAFRTGSNGSFYAFEWNGDGVNQWQIESNTGTPSVYFSYPGYGVSTPYYTFGTTVNLKVVATGSNFLCYADTGSGYTLIYNVTDTTYTSGGVGIRTYGVHEGNKIQVSNFSVDTCP